MAPLLSTLIKKYSVSYASFHSFLFNPSIFSLTQINENSCHDSQIQSCDVPGIAFVCGKRENGPFCDISLEQAAVARGYFLVDEDLGSPNLPLYDAAKNLCKIHCGKYDFINPEIFRAGQSHQSIVLNIFGGSCLSKGFTNQKQIVCLVNLLNKFYENLCFTVPVLPNQRHLVPCTQQNNSPVKFCYFDYADHQLTELVAGAPAIITVEGGILHLAVAYGKPTFCLIEPEWFDKVSDLLPPFNSYKIKFLNFEEIDFNILLEYLKGCFKNL